MCEKCFECGKELSHDEIGLYKKLVNRGSVKFMCISCTADYFGVAVSDLEEKIIQYKKMGCTLFVPCSDNE